VTAVRVVTRIQDADDFSGPLTNGYYLGYVAADQRFELLPLTVPVGANPTGSVGLAAVNGSAATFLRSDGAPALSQTIAPTWMGQHVFAAAGAASIKIIVQGTSSQSANLQEWQGSTGTVLAQVNSVGKWIGTQQVIAWDGSASMSQIGFVGPGGEGGIAFGLSNDAKMYRSGTRAVQCDAMLRAVAQNALDIPLTVKGAASHTGNLQEWHKSDATVYGTVSENGYFTTRKNAAPADAELVAGEATWWFDSTNGAAKLVVKAKTADGTVVTGSIPLA
jgi:hypothetical protein